MAKRYRISTPKRRYKVKRRRTRKSRIARMPATLIPASKVCKLRYSDTFILNAGIGAFANHQFRANGMHDPDYTGVLNHQPLGWDQWSLFYDHYTVISSKITVTFAAGGTGASNTSYVGIRLADTTNVTPSELSHAVEMNNFPIKFLTQHGARGVQKVSKTFSAKKFFGIKDISDNRGILGSAIGANPSEQAIFDVVKYPIDATTDPSPVDCMVVIEYLVKFTERKKIAQS